MKFNSVTVCSVRSLEVGDLIAKEFLGAVVSGKVTGIIWAGYQLTKEQTQYMVDNGLDIPKDEYEPISGSTESILLFGEFFCGTGINKDQPNHMYVSLDMNVAVFPTI